MLYCFMYVIKIIIINDNNYTENNKSATETQF